MTDFEVPARLTEFDDVAVGVADVGADLMAVVDRFGQEPGIDRVP